ncbi:unnamed protein product [Callosobruchus maculatus]|uniref:Uncharacterized protein n=1 Tax=Callosobruchus maculatus TaxID=64391 RepID=A0A653CBH9_CALMS|nr:unnamed protein product [Callosobruchus maculatus]
MAGKWHSTEEFEQDLNTYSEMSEIQEDSDEDDYAMPPQTVLDYQAQQSRNNTSIFTDNFLLEEGVKYVFSGRGRGIPSQIFAPGLRTADTPTDEDDIKRRIRQEVGHVGYDELCYSKYKRLNRKIEERQFVNAPEPITTQQLTSTANPSPTNSRGSCQHQSLKMSPQSLSDASRSSTPNNQTIISPMCTSRTPESSPKKTNMVSQNDGNAIVEEQENGKTNTTDQKPLPLSVMLRKARKKPPEKEKKPESPPEKAKSPQKNRESLLLNGKENGNLAANRNCISDKATETSPRSKAGLIDSSSSSDTSDDPWWRATEPNNWRDRTSKSPKFFKGNNTPWRRETKVDMFDVCSNKEFPPLQ